MDTERKITISYSCVQASFWMSLCIFMGFAAVYLQWLGYSNSGLGIVMACGTLLGTLLGPALSSVIDRSTEDRLTAAGMMPYVLAAEGAAIVMLLVVPVQGLVTSVSFALFIALSTSVNSLNLKLYTDAVYSGHSINYGAARSMGSVGYVMISFAAGELCELISPRIIPALGLMLCIFQYLSFRGFAHFITEDAPGSAGTHTADSAPGRSMITFLAENRRFVLILAGTTLIFFAHNTLCNFFINVVRNAGGDTGDMGVLNGFMALVETPVIFFYSRLTRRWKTSSVLRFSFILFTAKAAAVALAGSVASLAASLLLQAPSFGLYTGAIVPYVDKVIAHEDSAKAQSLAFSVTILGSVLASTISGRLFDVMSVSSVMWIACAACAAGSIMAVAGAADTGRSRP